jgi:uncharacterized membrane protein
MKKIFLGIVLAGAMLSPALATAQGCSMCRDTVAGSAPRMRESLRRAIPILGVSAGVLFLTMLTVAWRFDRRAAS